MDIKLRKGKITMPKTINPPVATDMGKGKRGIESKDPSELRKPKNNQNAHLNMYPPLNKGICRRGRVRIRRQNINPKLYEDKRKNSFANQRKTIKRNPSYSVKKSQTNPPSQCKSYPYH